MDSAATAVVAALAAEIAAVSVETVADSAAEVAAVSAPLVVKCSTQSAPNVVRKRKFPSSPAVLAPFIAGIASRPTARHVVVAAAVVAAADSATAVVAAIAVPAVTNPQAIL